MSDTQERRWVPINFLFNPDTSTVRWIDLGEKELTEPFLHQTVRHLRTLTPPAAERVTDLGDLLQMANGLPPVIPSGIIFHVSRCGSTLIANALREGKEVVTVSEARSFGMLFLPRALRASPFPKQDWADVRRTLLNALATVYAYCQRDGQPRLVIKCHAATMLHMSLVRKVWPGVPFLVVIRDPVEVMVSNLKLAATWLRTRNTELDRQTIFGWTGKDAQAMSIEEYCARGIGRFCEAAKAQFDGNCKVVDYAHLDVQRLCQIAEFFGISLPDENSDELRSVTEGYSKDRTGTRRFEGDREQKQQEASAEIRGFAEKWALGPYEALRALEL